MPYGLMPAVGGEIRLKYSRRGFSEGPISLAVAPFNLSPSGPDGDYLYTGTGEVVPTETGILATFAALGALWAPYYDPLFTLSLIAVYQNFGGALLKLPTTPTAAPIVGTYTGPIDADNTFKRTLNLWGHYPVIGMWRIYLRWLQGDRFSETLDVAATTGGYDARDQAWYAYLSGTATGVVSRDGTRFQAGGTVRQWTDTPLQPTVPIVISG